MGFGTSVAGSLIIITFLIVGVNFFVVLTEITETSTELLNERDEDVTMNVVNRTTTTSNATGTNITTLTTTLTNKGNVNLEPEKIDVYVEGIRKNRSNVETTILQEIDNPGLWSPGEDIDVSVEEETDTLDSLMRITITNNKGGRITTVIEVQ